VWRVNCSLFTFHLDQLTFHASVYILFLRVGGGVNAKSSQVPDVFVKEFPIAIHFYPICFGKCFPPFTYTSVYPVHNAPVPPPCYLLWTGSNLSSCTVVVNAPRSCWPDMIQQKKDKKRSKYVTLDFSAHLLFFIFYFVSSFLLI